MLRNMSQPDPLQLLALKVIDHAVRDAKALSQPYCCKKEDRKNLKHAEHQYWCRSRALQPGITTSDRELQRERRKLHEFIDSPDFGAWLLRAGALPSSIEERQEKIRKILNVEKT